MIPELHDMRIFFVLKAVTPAWVTNTVLFSLAIDYIHLSGSFEVLQAKVKCHSTVGLARPALHALNKQYSSCGRPMNVSFIYCT